MSQDWLKIFDDHASKVVSKTDKRKGAYVLNEGQKAVMLGADVAPTEGPSDRILPIRVLGTSGGDLSVSYYNSMREGANRTPEARMGREIVSWIQIGDVLTIGRIGKDLFLAKEKGDAPEPASDEIGRQLAKAVDPARIFAKVSLKSGPPPRRAKVVSDFVRDPYVVAAAICRAGGKCEMPDCELLLFERDDGRPYLEVHHIVPLAEGGDDTLRNAAALCPSCHRELHSGRLRKEKRAVLQRQISTKAQT